MEGLSLPLVGKTRDALTTNVNCAEVENACCKGDGGPGRRDWSKRPQQVPTGLGPAEGPCTQLLSQVSGHVPRGLHLGGQRKKRARGMWAGRQPDRCWRSSSPDGRMERRVREGEGDRPRGGGSALTEILPPQHLSVTSREACTVSRHHRHASEVREAKTNGLTS